MKHFTALWLLATLLTLIPLTLSAADATGANAFSISRSSADGIQLHFELPAWKLEDVKQGDRTLQRVSVADAPYIFINETETLPVFATMVAIPYSGSASLNILGSQQQNRSVVNLDFNSILSHERSAGKYTAALYPANSALISEPQVIRDFRVITVNIYPFQYDQQTGQLIVKQSMDLRIDFNNDPAWGDVAPPTAYSQAFEPIYKGLIINYEAAINRTLSYTNPRMLVIYGNFSDPIYLAKVNEYVAWKKQKGFVVNSVSTATTGTSNTAIKTYIQTQYDNVSTRPDYIVLIGDSGSGSMQVPTYGTYTDYYYTWLNGGDSLGDVIIGRISVENTDQMIIYMAKVASLEKNLNLNTASWLNKMVLVGDTAHSGISTIYTSEYIEDIASAVNPAYTYTEEFNGSPSNSNVNTAINNQGVAFYNYRGYIGMSGWPSYISQLSNQYKLFHAVIITCATGNFSGGDATTETVVRQGTAANLGGAITAIGMATSSTATPQNNCLDAGIFHSIYSWGARDMGTAMLYGKLYLNAVYGTSAPTEAANFAAYCNLIGDPTAEVYVGIPSTFNVSAPASIPSGASNVEITVRNANNEIISDASVSL
ncbi:MAG: C25 family cysteine peptidase, partial [Candidatus Cloacimonas sp.]|nr:C25 family cysteine peptidase [Candidatus Cloacimonas sp.]